MRFPGPEIPITDEGKYQYSKIGVVIIKWLQLELQKSR